MNPSKVTIILICHNQAEYVEEAILSVWSQTYENIELIIVDDASTDESQKIIERIIENKGIRFIKLEENKGNCAAFNRGFAESTGEYIIDLAADDILDSDKVAEQVSHFKSLPEDYGVIYSDASLIDENGISLGTQFEKIMRIGKVKEMPNGEVFKDVLAHFFIASPTQMIKRKVFDDIGLYDESLAFEDFDFWIRSSRNWKYEFLDRTLMTIRKLPSGMSANKYEAGNPMVESTLEVCKKALQLIQSNEEKKALFLRVRYEFRMAWKHNNKPMIKKWYGFMKEIGATNLVYLVMSKLK